MTSAWIDTSSAETGSSATMKRRLRGERSRDRDALALPAREGARDSARGARGSGRPCDSRAAAASFASERLSSRWSISDFDQRVADRHARIEARVGVLEDHLHVPAEAPQLPRRHGGYVLAVEGDAPGGRFDEPQQQAPERRFAGARLADDAQDLAARDVERNLGRRPAAASPPRPKRPPSPPKSFVRPRALTSGVAVSCSLGREPTCPRERRAS